jgi:hypothetical protein
MAMDQQQHCTFCDEHYCTCDRDCYVPIPKRSCCGICHKQSDSCFCYHCSECFQKSETTDVAGRCDRCAAKYTLPFLADPCIYCGDQYYVLDGKEYCVHCGDDIECGYSGIECYHCHKQCIKYGPTNECQWCFEDRHSFKCKLPPSDEAPPCKK